MNYLVTGCSGFSGAQIAFQLAVQGHNVIAIVGPNSQSKLAQHKNIKNYKINLSGNILIKEDVDIVVHAAARSAWPGVGVDMFVNDNIIATKNLISFSVKKKVKKFIFFSSISVYGEISTNLLDENTPIVNPQSYGLSKLICEEMLNEVCRCKVLSGVSIRLPGIIGKDSVRNWITKSYFAAKRGEPIYVSNPKSSFNNVVHISDLVSLISAITISNWDGHEIVTAGSSGVITAGKVAEIIAGSVNLSSSVIVGGAYRKEYLISTNKLNNLFKYKPSNVKEVIEKFINENKI
jgi:nucleoside-diphosphate-sugar epimerase